MTPSTSSSPAAGLRRLPLIPLSEEVCFPRTEIRLRVVAPDYRRLVEEVWHDGRPLGTVLLRSGRDDRSGEASVYGAGTSARLIDVEHAADGCHVVLEGCRRFEITRLVPAAARHGAGPWETEPWREGWVQPMDEPQISELDPDVQSLRREILDSVDELSSELGERFALGRDELDPLSRGLTFEAMVNHLSANLDLAPPKKLQLLRYALPERARFLSSILRGRLQMLDALRPYRRLAPFAERH